MPISSIQFTCPCISSTQKQTALSRSYRIASAIAAILLLGVSALIVAGTFPLDVKVVWGTGSSALVLFALGFFTRCVPTKKKDSLEEKKIQTDDEIEDSLFLIRAGKYYREGNLEASFETVKKVQVEREDQEEIFILIAEAYLSKLCHIGCDRKAAKKGAHDAIEALYYNREGKEKLSVQLAREHCEDEEYNRAFNILSDVRTKTVHSDAIYLTIAEGCLKENEELARKALDEVKHQKSQKEKLLSKIGGREW